MSKAMSLATHSTSPKKSYLLDGRNKVKLIDFGRAGSFEMKACACTLWSL